MQINALIRKGEGFEILRAETILHLAEGNFRIILAADVVSAFFLKAQAGSAGGGGGFVGHSVTPVGFEVIDAIHDGALSGNAATAGAEIFIAIPSTVGLEGCLGGAAVALPGLLEHDHERDMEWG
jgi:hypothetical protein